MIILGCDTHKSSHTVVAIDIHGKQLGKITVQNNSSGFANAKKFADKLDNEKVWGVENSQHYGKHLAQFLIENNEQVYEISPKLTAQLRKRSLKSDKSDIKDALAIAKAVIQEKNNLHKVPSNNTDYAKLKEITRFRDSIVKKKTDFINQLHKALYSFDPEYKVAVGNITTEKALKLVEKKYVGCNTNNPLENILKTEIIILLNLIRTIDNNIKEIEKECIKPICKGIQSPLSSIDGIGDVTLSVLLGEIGDISGYKNAGEIASRAGISPIENSSAKNNYKRVNPGGNRHLNTTLHRVALYQMRKNELGKKYYGRKKEEGKTPREALRCLKRRLVDVIYAVLRDNKEYYVPKIYKETIRKVA